MGIEFLRPGTHDGITVTHHEPIHRKLNGHAPSEKLEYLEAARPLVHFDEFAKDLKQDWAIKGVLARGHTSYTFGPPGSGKSALLASAATHLGAGAPEWHGFKIKRQAATVFFALERGLLTQKRIWAESNRDGLGKVPVAISSGLINLMDPACAKMIVGTILRAEDDLGTEVGLVGIDTFGKAIAAGGGEENQASDQNKAWGHLRLVHEYIARWHNLHIAAIGHTGKDESRGARGSNAAAGDNDVELQISIDGPIKNVAIFKANELPEGDLMRFRMEPYDTGEKDEDGDAVEIWIAANETLKPIKAASVVLTANQKTMYRMLFEAGHGGLSTAEWNDRARELGIGKSRRATLYDIQSALKDKHLVKEYGDRWYVDHKSE